MRFSTTFLSLAVPYLALAAPIRRAADATDMLVLQFARTLELLETQFYTEALAKFTESDFTAAGFPVPSVPIDQFKLIRDDEASHVSILESTIIDQGGKPIEGCKFDFTSVLTDVKTMAPVARLVEQVGVSAYLGAAALITDKQILTAAGSILTIEARHQTMLNVMNSGTSISQAFDVPLLPNQVLAIAGPFISGCDLGVPANPTLSVTNTGAVQAGTTLDFKSTGIDGLDRSTLSCQMVVGGAPFAISLPIDQCVVPDGIDGVVYLYITNTTQPIQPNLANQLKQSIVAGPTIAFIDSKESSLSQLIVSASGSSSSSTGSSSSSSSIPSSSTPSSSGTTGMTAGPDFKVGSSMDKASLVLGWSNLPQGVTPQ